MVQRQLTESDWIVQVMKDTPQNEHALLFYKEIFKRSVDAIVILDKDGIYLDQNQAHIDLLGYPNDELIGKTANLHMDEKTTKYIVDELSKKGIFQGVTESVKKDGTSLKAECSIFLARDSSGAVQGSVGVVRDVTEREHALTALSLSEERFRQTFEGIPDPAYIFEKEKDGRIRLLLVNQAIREMTQDRIMEQIGKTAEDIFPETKAIVNLIKKVMKSGKGEKSEVTFDDPSMSEEKLVICTISRPSKNLVFLVTEDITETRKLFEALQYSELEKSLVLNAMSEHVVYYNSRDMKIAWTNRAAAESIGKKVEELIGQTCHQMWHQSDQPCSICPVIRAAETGEVEEEEVTTPDGRSWHIRGHTLFNDKQELVGLLEITREITAQKKADQLLRDSEEQYRSILESMEDSIHVVDEDLTIILQNPALTQWMTELDLDSNITGKRVIEAFPFLSNHTIEEYHQIFQTGEIKTSLESTILHGTEYTTNTRKIPIIREGKTYQIITVIRNITEQYGAQIALQESESRYRLLYENLADGILVTDPKNIITFASDKAGSLLGYSTYELVGKGLVEFVHPDDTKWVIMAFRESLQKGGVDPVGLDVRGIKKDGTEYVFHISSAVISRNGKFEGYQLLISDVTERIHAVETVLIEREKYRILFDAAPVAIGVATTSGKVIDVNKHMLDMLGYTRDEMKSLGASAIYSDSAERQKWLDRLQEEKHVRNFEVEYVTSQGKKIDILMNIDEVEFGQEGRVQLSTLRDITELNQTRRKLMEASARAEFFNDLMAHDLNNIHQGVLMSLELILMSEGITPDAHDKAEAAYEQIRKSIGLISSVRKLSNIELHTPELIETDVNLVASEAIRLVKHAFPEKKPEIEISFDRHEIMVMADEFLIDAFYNLIHNSMKVSDSIPEIQITAKLSETDGFINIAIADKGPGISDDRKDMLFTRLDTGRTLGSGIGLTLVKRIMERYYGTVWIEDRIPEDYTKGAKIVLQLPLSPNCYLSKK